MAQILFLDDGCIENTEQAHRDYLGGSLSDEQCWEIDKHLMSCPICEKKWDELTAKLEATWPSEIREVEDDSEDDEGCA